MAAIMPKQYRKRQPGKLEELMKGECAWLRGTDVVLNGDGGTYLRLSGKVYFTLQHVRADGDPHVVAVRRNDDGKCYVYLYKPKRALKWETNPNLDIEGLVEVEDFLSREEFETLCPKLAEQIDDES